MIVPEPCGYAVLLLIANIQKTVPVRPGKKLHAPVGVPPSGLLTSLRLLVQCLPPATTRRTGGEAFILVLDWVAMRIRLCSPSSPGLASSQSAILKTLCFRIDLGFTLVEGYD